VFCYRIKSNHQIIKWTHFGENNKRHLAFVGSKQALEKALGAFFHGNHFGYPLERRLFGPAGSLEPTQNMLPLLLHLKPFLYILRSAQESMKRCIGDIW